MAMSCHLFRGTLLIEFSPSAKFRLHQPVFAANFPARSWAGRMVFTEKIS